MKKEKNTKYQLPLNYGSESVDVTLYCNQYLLENNFHQNDVETNIQLLEKAMINYSIIKMNDFNIDLESIQVEDIDNLSYLLKSLDKKIPTKEEKDGFFAQYVHCIIYIYSNIIKQAPMKWKKTDEINAPQYYIIKTNKDTTLYTHSLLDAYKIPVCLLKMIYSYHDKKEKNPVLQK